MISISASDFKAYFSRGQFTFGTVLPAVLDADITKAIAEANAILNPGLYPSDALGNQALEYLTAHFLQGTLDAQDSGGQAEGIQSARGAGGISESIAVPQWILDSPEMSVYATTFYGRRWIALTLPYLGGNVYTVGGGTQP
jgi:hypothetical protein